MRKLIILFCLSISIINPVKGQEDTASVTYIPSVGIYLLEYTYDGVTYRDTLEPATKIEPLINCSVLFNRIENIYTYYYIVSLLNSSQQYLISFSVEHPASIISPLKPNSRWTQGEFAQYRIWDWSNSKMDPTGLWSDTTDIGPGGSLSGFSFKSYGLPIIVNSYFEGNAPSLAFTDEPPAKMEQLLAPILHFPNNTVIRKTLGPKLPPSPFNSIHFLDTLKSYTTQSRTLGWIANQHTANKYLAYFDTAKARIHRGENKSARNALNTVLQNANQDSSGLLTSEAYALIRFNTEYLIENLPLTNKK